MRLFLKNDKGFSLIEILVAVTIVGISFAIIAEGYVGMSRLVQQMKEYQLTSSFARERITQIVQKIDTTTAGSATLTGDLKVTWNAVIADMGDGVRRLTVYVDWKSQKGPKQYEMTTLIEGGSYE